MTPPRWVDDQGQLCPTRPCPTCGRVIPIKRWEVLSVVEWCGHRQEMILVPDGEEWYAEIPVLGVAT